MKLPNKLQTLLTDLTDKALRRQYHASCEVCHWQVYNLNHLRFAERRAEMHFRNAHGGELDGANWDCYMRLYYSQVHEVKLRSRA